MGRGVVVDNAGGCPRKNDTSDLPKPTGGPAFPVQESPRAEGPHFPENGVTKREYFAAKAMAGLCANVPAREGATHEDMAKIAVAAADALLAELEKS